MKTKVNYSLPPHDPSAQYATKTGIQLHVVQHGKNSRSERYWLCIEGRLQRLATQAEIDAWHEVVFLGIGKHPAETPANVAHFQALFEKVVKETL